MRRYGRRMSRRTFLGLGGMGAAALALGGCGVGGATSPAFGPPVEDPEGIIDLPKGFRYRVISDGRSRLSGGVPLPGDPDGMAAFRGPKGATILVRNHELEPDDDGHPVIGENPYRRSQRGGTTAVVIGADGNVIEEYITSSGTNNNCAGGATPWGTWLTCEEALDADHGYVFEIMPDDPENDLSKTPIRAMGHFSHEAVAVDPDTGVVYLTEDDFRGEDPDDPSDETIGSSRVSFLYRYLPEDTSPRPGALQKGGVLQTMALEEKPDFNADFASTARRNFAVVWKDVNPDDAHDDAERKGAARFNRLEGAYFSGGALWFDDTLGGEERRGQLFRYFPEDGKLELFYEGGGGKKIKQPDQLTIAPWGDLWFAEDGDEGNRIIGVTPERKVYAFAKNRLNDSEMSGPAFSPDGKTFFVNIYDSGVTLAIWGPFARPNAAARRLMALATPPGELAPGIPGELAEASERHAMTLLEAAAYDRLGIPLA